ncbi:Alcohol dehydrogenase [acceptor] [Lamellibrachia satsuma]|nr:Alcohol dehydrogenase [acceptor] [Lamellibrachia satsuma]
MLVATLVGCAVMTVWQGWPTVSHIQSQLLRKYDYIIVGAGSAGCVLANRLSEDGDKTVLLLEAGVEELEMHMSNIPSSAFELQRSQFDWSFMTVPQRHGCKGLENQQMRWPSGKGLGGTSNINYLVYLRGSPHNYDSWAENGCDGWSYNNVLPYFIKAEKNQNMILAYSKYHGRKGPLVVNDMYVTPLSKAFVDAGIELGHKNVDANGKEQLGVSASQGTINRGKRWSTASAYLRPVMGRSNLHVATMSHVTKVS